MKAADKNFTGILIIIMDHTIALLIKDKITVTNDVSPPVQSDQIITL